MLALLQVTNGESKVQKAALSGELTAYLVLQNGERKGELQEAPEPAVNIEMVNL